MMMKINKPFVLAGNRRCINLNHVRDVSWEFNDDGNTLTRFIFNSGEYLEVFLDEKEFLEFLRGLNHATI